MMCIHKHMPARDPSVPVARGHVSSSAWMLIRRRDVAFGMAGASFFFMGQFALFTYLRPSSSRSPGSWLARTLPKDAGAGGGVMAAVVQLAIMLGELVGGLLFDAGGYRATFSLGAGLLVIAAVFAVLGARAGREHPQLQAGQGISRSARSRANKSKNDASVAW